MDFFWVDLISPASGLYLCDIFPHLQGEAYPVMDTSSAYIFLIAPFTWPSTAVCTRLYDTAKAPIPKLKMKNLKHCTLNSNSQRTKIPAKTQKKTQIQIWTQPLHTFSYLPLSLSAI